MAPLTRREFAESVALVALVPFIGAGSVSLPVGWWETAAPRSPIAPSGELEAMALALAAAVRAQYGSRLSEADLAAVTRQIRNALERAERMRAVELANGDEPDFVFSPPGDPRR